MTKQVRIRRGTTAQVDAFTGVVGEIVIDTDRLELRVQNGVAAGLRVPRFGGSFGAAAGSAALPSLFANGDVDTGMLFPAADTVAISTAGVNRFEVGPAGNAGLGVPPSAWQATYKAVDVGVSGSFFGRTSGTLNNTGIYANAFVDSNGVSLYKNTDEAGLFQYADGNFSWLTAPSGTAGATITFTQAMTLFQAGQLILGGTTLSTGAFAEFTSTTGAVIVPRMTTTQRDALGAAANGAVIYNTTTNKMNFRENGAWVQPTVTAA